MPSPPPLSSSTPPPTSLLILGAGWTSTYLLPYLTSLSIPHACTSTTARAGTIPFVFHPSSPPPSTSHLPPVQPLSNKPSNPSSSSPPPSPPPPSSSQPASSSSPPPSSSSLDPYRLLPPALTILITFPLRTSHSATQLITSYRAVHGTANTWILLGSTGIWPSPSPSPSPSTSLPITEASPYDLTSPRAQAEDRFLEILGEEGTVLCLAGLWGGERHPRHWIARVAGSKEALAGKGSLHLVHGRDVSRAVVAAHLALRTDQPKRTEDDGDKAESEREEEEKGGVGGKRWIITDGWVYDWWEIVMVLGGERERGWVRELMRERGVGELPRGKEGLGRRLDGRAFWGVVGGEGGEGLFAGEDGSGKEAGEKGREDEEGARKEEDKER